MVFRRIVSVLLVGCTVLTLASCTVASRAIGDGAHRDDIVHDGIDVSDMHVLLIGSHRAQLDQRVLTQLQQAGVPVSYAATASLKNSMQVARQALLKALDTQLRLVLIDEYPVGASYNVQEQRAWNEVLFQARDAGMPVVLINPQTVPKDPRLFAAILRVSDDNLGLPTSALLPILRAVIDNTVHPREVQIQQ